ncbi:hypothetical protein F2Q68_00036205 [Brassica cretica]|uniref:Uncharacterized protein n=1 Tax=Brassica cretica TaxID=69181 RepID=A0A8S9H3Q8_BRACR|nr:hypothetical protein F2Q68_00036205 [Brassica cretica]
MYVHRLNTFKHLFKEGSMYVSMFDGTRSNLNFMLSDSPLSIRLNDSTTFKEKTVPNSPHFQGKDLVMVTIKINSDLPVTLIVFDCQTLSFQKQVHGLRGCLFLNATAGTRLYFDKAGDGENPGDSQLPRFFLQTLHARATHSRGGRLPLPDFVTDEEGNNGPGDDMPGMTSLSTEVCVGGDKKDKGPTLETTSIGLITKNSHGTSSSKFTKKAHIT